MSDLEDISFDAPEIDNESISDEELLAIAELATKKSLDLVPIGAEVEQAVKELDAPILPPAMPDDPDDLLELKFQAGVIECGGSPISYVSDKRSSLVLPPAPVPLEEAFLMAGRVKKKTKARAVNILHALSKWGRNKPKVIEERLKVGTLFALAQHLEAIQADLLEGDEVAIIVTGRKVRERYTPSQLLARHYMAVPLDGLVMIALTATQQQLKLSLRNLGLSEGRDYEFLGPENLTKIEQESFRRLLRVRPSIPLHIVRRLSKVQPKL